MKEIIQDLSYSELEELILSLGEKKFRARQLAGGLTKGKRISEISTLSKDCKAKLLERFEDAPVVIKERFTSSDGTEKFLFSLADGNLVEGVAMRYKYGVTQCVSTQVGCRMGCAFCASTLHGLIRNLTAGEILAQVLLVNALLSSDNTANASSEGGMSVKSARAVTNVVLMGSGEPLDNYGNTVKFCLLYTSPSPRDCS